jgi:2-octaprenyl-6-methoxyphenol hydroxylase
MSLQQSSSIPFCESAPSSSAGIHYDYDLVIVGGGIAGVTLACALKHSGLRIALVEAQVRSQAVAKEQAYAISLLSGQIFEGIGVWQAILPKIAKFRQIRLSDAHHPRVVQFSPRDLGTEVLGYVAEHRVLLTALQDFLQQCPTVNWLCPAEVVATEYQPQGAKVTVNWQGKHQTLWTRLVVAADGSRSPLRQQAGIRTHGWQYWQSCIVATVQPEKPHQDIAYERFWASGPFAILPLPENRCRIVWTAPKAEAEALVALDDKQFLVELGKRYGQQMGKLSLVGRRYAFPVQLMQSDRYTLPRLALVGDAAHCCHPVGGQGLNMGIRDVAALAQVLQAAYQNGEDIGDLRVLRRYENWRKRENLVILGFTDFLNRFFSNNILPLVLVRRFGLWILQTIQPFKSLALRLMTGLLGRTPSLVQR